ncbi:MAG: hypothetical protein Athens101428_510 [Candidatus Berkelbacteria bacterium Athens1014_28]|uniref:Uncharacterized protein n=1 Tax=Candidatus Berkelbacteria bacterium Athens1014_28 TaxID=2017145 RepID=A0A554LLX5_9BACT|nr:MAG: hypothetical protein Athens101428_510 [Candidatus Berkelbacteria bacterium Athens1014_28]
MRKIVFRVVLFLLLGISILCSISPNSSDSVKIISIVVALVSIFAIIVINPLEKYLLKLAEIESVAATTSGGESAIK